MHREILRAIAETNAMLEMALNGKVKYRTTAEVLDNPNKESPVSHFGPVFGKNYGKKGLPINGTVGYLKNHPLVNRVLILKRPDRPIANAGKGMMLGIFAEGKAFSLDTEGLVTALRTAGYTAKKQSQRGFDPKRFTVATDAIHIFKGGKTIATVGFEQNPMGYNFLGLRIYNKINFVPLVTLIFGEKNTGQLPPPANLRNIV